MYPIKLTMSAFGSYAGKQEISFDENRGNLFLITGDTGAGKTTIFDAICFAFYGEMSGENREGKMMRSDYALSDQKTYVEFVFEDKGKLYKIIRNPEYFRKSKKKKKKENGSFEYNFVKETAKAELIFFEGFTEEENSVSLNEIIKKKDRGEITEKSFTGNLRETNAKIMEILGLTKEQFTQIAMIAQGEFLKLLVSSTDQKKEIFQKLFHTQKYQQIVKMMSERKKEKEAALEKNKTEQEMILQETECMEGSQYKEEFESAKKMYFLHPEEFQKILEFMIKENEETLSRIKKELETIKGEKNQLLLEINTIEQINRLFKNLSEAYLEKEKWEREEIEIQKKEIMLENADKAEKVAEKKAVFDEIEKKTRKKTKEIEKRIKEREKTETEYQENEEIFALAEKEKEEKEDILKNEIQEIEKNLPEYDEIEEIKMERKKQEKVQKKLCQKIEELDQTIKKQERELSVWEQWKMETEETVKELPEKKMLLVQKEESLFQYKDLEKEAEKIKELQDKKEKSKKQVQELKQKFREKNRLYEDMMLRFMSGQAGLMAENLRNKTKEPCPVCGNIHYVHLAPLEPDMPAQQQVKRVKKQRDDIEQRMQVLAEEAGNDKLSYDRQYFLCQEKLRQLTDGKITLEEDAGNLSEITKIILKLEKEKANLEIENQRIEKLETEREEYRKKIQKTKEELEKEKRMKEEIKEKKVTAEQELSKLQTAEEIHKKNLVYKSRKQADLNLQKRKEMLDEIICRYQKLQEKQESLHHQLLRQKTEEETMQRELEVMILEVEEKREIYENTKKEQGFLSEKAWLLARADEDQRRAWKKEIEQVKKEVIAARQSVIELEKQLQGKEKKNEIKLKEVLEKREKEIEEILKEQQIREIQQDKNWKAWKKLKEKSAVCKNLEYEHKQIKTLYEVANGTLAGAVKVDLETFVQRQYLKQVLKAANRRFLTMSKGQFELRLKDGKNFDQRSNQGLDLSVYSLLTDTNRDIKTLSGGESFMAALSMALGMADIIQSMAGGIHLDMMFIDEGFGSLDEQSRQQAVKVLQELSDGKRMIGIISHVTELKEQVGRRLVVKKSEKGSRAYWE